MVGVPSYTHTFSIFSTDVAEIKTGPGSTRLVYTGRVGFVVQFVYYETIRRKLNRRLICESRCDERLKAKLPSRENKKMFPQQDTRKEGFANYVFLFMSLVIF